MRLPGPLTGEQEKQLATIKTSAMHLLALINDILDVAKIDARRVEVQLEAVDVKEVVEEVAAAMRSLAQQKDLALDVSVPAAPVVLASDRRLLSQILINLAGNAIKFTERGRVAIAVRDEGRAVVFDVEDSGRGIREEDRARLFEAFSQLDTQSTKPRDGTGLGLHLSQRLAGLLGGAISMESVLDRGSRFTLRLARP
jgi:signal transduction histidine kinase